MAVFSTLLLKLIPLYLMIGLGFIAGRFLDVKKESVAKLLIYIFAPAVYFYGAVQADLNTSTLILPLLFLAICSLMSFLSWNAGKALFSSNDNTRNLLGFTGGSANTGYFAIPVALLIFGDKSLSPIIFCSMGYIIYECTIGFFIMARGNYSARESLYRLLKLPTIYVFILGISLNFAHVQLGQIVVNFMETFKSTYTVLGMMMIGVGLAAARLSSFDFKFITVSFFAKFIVWPLLMIGLISLDKTYFHFYDKFIHNVMFLMAIVPLAANTVTFATELKVQPEKAAVTVLLSTLFALFYIPLLVTLLKL